MGASKDQIHAVGAQVGGKGFAFLGRVVHDEHAIHTGCGGVAHKGAASCARGAVLLVVAFHGVGVAHQHHRGGVVAFAEFAHLVQHLHHANAQAQSLLARLLDHRAIGHGV